MNHQIFNQKQAAIYLTKHGCSVHESQLSRMGKYGDGPEFSRLGSQKIFTKDELDRWLAKESESDTNSDAQRIA